MKINLEINNITKSPVEKRLFETVIKKTLSELGLAFLKNKEMIVSLALVTPEEIKKLNKQYRQNDSVTDILSFPEYENIEKMKLAAKEAEEKLFLGELILCYDDIKEYADEKSLDLVGELAKVVAHGALHLLGFSHGEKMFVIQNKVKNHLISDNL